MEWFLKVVKEHYADFDGRARRQEYWMYTLFYVIGYAILAVIEAVAGIPPFLSGIYSLALFVPSLAVAVRRLHDVNKSGWYYLMVLIPIVGGIIILIKFCTEGDKGANQYGEDPKGGAAGTVSNNPFE